MKIKNTQVESTPFISVEITDKARKGTVVAWFQLYHTIRAGTYGFQVCYRCADKVNTPESVYFEGKTSGCGYCKETAATEDCLKHIIGKHLSLGRPPDTLFKQYHKGGNSYTLSLSQLKALLSRNP